MKLMFCYKIPCLCGKKALIPGLYLIKRSYVIGRKILADTVLSFNKAIFYFLSLSGQNIDPVYCVVYQIKQVFFFKAYYSSGVGGL